MLCKYHGERKEETANSSMVQHLASPNSVSRQVHAAKQLVACSQSFSCRAAVRFAVPAPTIPRHMHAVLIKPFRNHTHERKAMFVMEKCVCCKVDNMYTRSGLGLNELRVQSKVAFSRQ